MALPVTVSQDIQKILSSISGGDVDAILNSTLSQQSQPQFDALAEELKTEETEDIGLFWKALDYLVRPQRAVAGVIHDAMDGGDFSPLDRVSEALYGNERYRMKNVIDLIAPGQWSNMRMPEWLGGKEIDIAKESLGFVGDVLTDPIMALAPFSVINKAGSKLRPITGQTEKAIARWGKKSPELVANINRAGLKEAQAVGAATDLTAGYARYRGELAQMNYVYRQAAKDPKAFAAEFGIDERLVKAGLGPSIRGTGSELLLPRGSEQIAAGQRGGLMTVKTPWLMQKLGIPEKSFSMIPALDRQAGIIMARGMEKLWAGAMSRDIIAKQVKALQTLFKVGMGSKLADHDALVSIGKTELYGKELAGDLEEIKDILGGNLDSDFSKKVMDYVAHPKDGFGQIARTVPPEYAPAVEKYNNLMLKIKNREAANPLLRKQTIKSTYTKQESYYALRKKIEREAPELIDDFPPQAKLNTLAERKAIDDVGVNTYESRWHDHLDTELNKGWRRGAERGKDVEAKRKTIMADLVDGKLEEGMKLVMAGRIANSIPYREMGYVPRVMTPEFKEVFQSLLKSTTYNNQSALSYVMSHSMHRKFYEFDTATWNQMWKDGDMPYDFMREIQKQVRAAGPKSEVGKTWNKMLSFLDNPQIEMYNENLAELAYIRAKSSLRAVGNADYQAQLIKNVSRTLGLDEPVGQLGEHTYLLSPHGMETVYGAAWRSKFPKDATEAYDAILKRNRLAPDADNLHSPFIETLGHTDLQTLKQKGLPIHAMNSEVSREMGKWMKMRADPREANIFMQNYDEFQSWWKATTLAPWPGFWLRNFGGNFWQAYGADSLSLKGYMNATGLVMDSDVWKSGLPKGKVVGGGITGIRDGLRKGTGRNTLDAYDIRVGDTVHSGAKQVQDMTRFGALNNFAQREIYGGAQVLGGQKSALQRVLRTPGVKWLTQYGTPVETGWWINSQMENVHRIALYQNRLKKGFTPFESAMEVKKYFFDYDMLTSFEKTYLKRWFPFYSWTRNNIPLQVHLAITKPAKFGNFKRMVETYMQSDEAKEFDMNKLPKFVNEGLGIPTRINKETGNLEVMYGRYWWPGSDLMSVIHYNVPKSSLRTLGTLLGPVPKFAVEKMSGQNLYTGQPIEAYPGQETKFLGVPFEKASVHKLKTFRGLSEINKLMSGGPGGREIAASQRLMNFMGLPKSAAFNPEILDQRRKFDIAMLKGKLKKDYTKAVKVGDTDLAQRILERARAAENRKAAKRE